MDPRLREALHLLDPPPGERLWYGGATALGSLRGVRAKQAAWKPAPDRHSIWELALHIAYWKYAVRRRLDPSIPRGAFPRGPSNWPRVPSTTDAKAWDEDRALLRDEHRSLVALARGLDATALDRRTGKGQYRNLDLLFGVATHDIYHAAQIQLLKRLWGSRGSGPTV